MTQMVRIEADGQPGGSRVYLGDHDISDRVVSVTWSHSGPDSLPKATVTLALFPLTLATTRVQYVDSHGRKIKRIVFEDGLTLDSTADQLW